MRWQDVDLTGGWWTIPANVSKNKLQHRVPLTASVVALLKTLRPENPIATDYVLAGGRGKRQQSEAAATFGVKDFRGQAIKPGTYSLRYELIPEDGNHLGVSANRDFLLAVPVASDADPNASFEFQQVVNMSKPAIGGNHPSPWSLVPAEKGDVPRVYQNADGFDVLVANVTTSAGKTFPLALVVKGQAQQ